MPLRTVGTGRSILSASRLSLSKYIKSLPNLLAYYPLDETSGTSARNIAPTTDGLYNGTNTGATVNQSGVVGTSYNFGGDGDRVVVTGLVPAVTMSFICAIKLGAAPDQGDRIIDQASGGPTKGWNIGLDSDRTIRFQTWNGGGIQLNLSYGIVALNTWVVIGASTDGTSTSLYLNGVEVTTGGGNSFGTGVIADLHLGTRSGGTTAAFNGNIQHLAIASGVKWTASEHAKAYAFFLT